MSFLRIIGALIVLVIGSVVSLRLAGHVKGVNILLDELNRSRSVTPEVLTKSNWLYWCHGGDPGVLSGGTEFLAAHEFSRSHHLKYNGPKDKTKDTFNWYLIFVMPDGSYSTMAAEGFMFDWDYGQQLCWFRDTSEITIRDQEVLKVERKND